MKLAAGKYYRTRAGQEVYCVGQDPYRRTCLMVGKSCSEKGHILEASLRSNGRVFKSEEKIMDIPQDVVEEL